MNTHTVTSIMFLTWSSVRPSEAPSILVEWPQTSAVNKPDLKPTAATAMKVTMGTTLAIVTSVLTRAALGTPRKVRIWTTQSTTEATRMARKVLPPSNDGHQ